MKKCFTYGSVRGAARKGGSYRDSLFTTRWASRIVEDRQKKMIDIVCEVRWGSA